MLDISDLIAASTEPRPTAPASRFGLPTRRYPGHPPGAIPDALVLSVWRQECASCGRTSESCSERLLVRFGGDFTAFNGPQEFFSSLPRERTLFVQEIPFCQACFGGQASFTREHLDLRALDTVLYPWAKNYSPIREARPSADLEGTTEQLASSASPAP